MNRATSDRFNADTPDDIAYGEGACLETPPAVFARLKERFPFTLDLTANEKNHLCPAWFGPGSYLGQDALTSPWYRTTSLSNVGYSNPPYGSFIPKVLAKAIQERQKGFTSVFLLPNRSAEWFKDLVVPYYSELWYLQSRLTFPYLGKPRIDPTTKQNKEIIARNERTRIENERRLIVNHSPQIPMLDLKPDGALFDSIVVVYRPYEISRWGLFPPAQRPNVWNPKTGELRY